MTDQNYEHMFYHCVVIMSSSKCLLCLRTLWCIKTTVKQQYDGVSWCLNWVKLARKCIEIHFKQKFT